MTAMGDVVAVWRQDDGVFMAVGFFLAPFSWWLEGDVLFEQPKHIYVCKKERKKLWKATRFTWYFVSLFFFFSFEGHWTHDALLVKDDTQGNTLLKHGSDHSSHGNSLSFFFFEIWLTFVESTTLLPLFSNSYRRYLLLFQIVH